MMRSVTAAALGLLLLGWLTPAGAQPILLERGRHDLGAPVVRHVKSELGIDYRTESKYHVNVRVVQSAEKTLTWKVCGFDGVTQAKLEWQLKDWRGLRTIDVTISSARLAEMHPRGLPTLERVLNEVKADAANEAARLVAELGEFKKTATPNFLRDGRLLLPGGIYPELAQAVEQHVRKQLGKTAGEYLAVETEVEFGRSRKNQITPVEGKPGAYRFMVGAQALARIAKRNPSLKSDWLAKRLELRWAGGGAPTKTPKPRFTEYVARDRVGLKHEAEARKVFQELLEGWAKAAPSPTEAARIRAVELSFDTFREIGIRSKYVELFKRGHVEFDFGEEVKRFKANTLHVETELLEQIAKQAKTAEARQRLVREAFTAELAKSFRPQALKVAEVATKAGLDLEPFRRADKTVDWGAATKAGVFRQVGGAAHFAMALFLKELAVTVQTGDQQRLEEFFEFLTTTDFFVTYGLFAAGAQAGSVAYNKFLANRIKPRFVSGILRTNLVLATGMALPELAHGRFSGKAFAIDLGSLGLASTAVKSAVEGIRWVTNLKQAERAGKLARASTNLRRLARAGGWFYTAAETAVVLYLGDEIAQRYRAHLDEEAARAALGDATTRFLETTLDPNATPRQVEEALLDFSGAQADYRNSLFRGLDAHGQTYAARLAKAAKKAKLLTDERTTLAKRLASLPSLEERIVAKHGSVAAYLDSQQAEGSAELDRRLGQAMEAFEAARKKELQVVYGQNRRKAAFALDLSDADRIRFLTDANAAPGQAGDPYDGRTDLLARRGRDSDRRALREAAGMVSKNRLQAFGDERAILTQVRPHLSPANRKVIDRHIAELETLEGRERELFGLVSPGLAKTLQQAGR